MQIILGSLNDKTDFLDLEPFGPENEPNDEKNLIILGNILSFPNEKETSLKLLLDVIEKNRNEWQNIFYIPGLKEFKNDRVFFPLTVDEVEKEMRLYFEKPKINIKFLNNDLEHFHSQFYIFGAVFWQKINWNENKFFQSRCKKFGIYKNNLEPFCGHFSNCEHFKTICALENALIKTEQDKKRLIICTHFRPHIIDKSSGIPIITNKYLSDLLKKYGNKKIIDQWICYSHTSEESYTFKFENLFTIVCIKH